MDFVSVGVTVVTSSGQNWRFSFLVHSIIDC